jgi:hypothetical protein
MIYLNHSWVRTSTIKIGAMAQENSEGYKKIMKQFSHGTFQ